MSNLDIRKSEQKLRVLYLVIKLYITLAEASMQSLQTRVA